MIEVDGLKKAYGEVQALRGVSFHIGKGEIVGLLGPNGAGKTTIIKILTGYLQPDEGTVKVDSLDVLLKPREIQARIGYLPENAPLYPELSVQNYLRMMAELRQIPPEEQLAAISEAVLSVGLEEHLTRPISQLSKGFRQRVGLAQAIIHKPRLLILDEPTVGLDPTQIVEIRRLIKKLSQHSTVLFSTHILPEVEALCDRAMILMNGEIKADARLADLEDTSKSILVFTETPPGAQQVLQATTGVVEVVPFETRLGFPAFQVAGDGSGNLNTRLFELAGKENWPLRELKYESRTLETVFNELAMAK